MTGATRWCRSRRRSSRGRRNSGRSLESSVKSSPRPGSASRNPTPGGKSMAVVAEQTTAFALAEKSKLIKSLRRFDMVFFTVCAFVGLDTLGTVASNGPEGFLWLVVLAFVFVAPYMLLMSEIGSAFTMEGGPYEWVKLAFGRVHGGIA